MKKLKFYSIAKLCVFIAIGFLSFTISSCDTNKQQKKSIKKIVTPKVKKKKIKKKKRFTTDTITKENAVIFFRKYGKEHSENKVLLSTRLGDITIKLYKNTPLHRASFLYLTNIGYFNTTCFYRVVPDFIVQGGNSENEITQEIKAQVGNYLLPSEFRKNRLHKRGVIAAARDWEYNPEKKSTPFEFYFIQGKNDQSHLNFEHTVFGEIIDGIEVIDKITAEKIDRYEWPQTDVLMKLKVLK